MRVTSKGQVTIPQTIREQMGFLPDTEIEFCVNDGRVYLRKLEEKRDRGKRMIARMRGRATASMSTSEIMALTRGTVDGHSG